MALTVVDDAAAEPISLTEAKAHLRVTDSGEDTYITSLIRAVRETTENHIGRALIDQTLLLTYDRWPYSRVLKLERPPLQSVTWIKYFDSNGVEQTLDSSKYLVDVVSDPGRIQLKQSESWPSLDSRINAVSIQFEAGYGDAGSDVPPGIVQAMLFLLGHWYANREPVVVGSISSKIPDTFDKLIFPHVVFY